MNQRLKRKWIIVGLVWSVVLAMTGLNLQLASTVNQRRQRLETTRTDLGFLRSHRQEIDQVRQLETRRVHRVSSLDMGFIVVESDLKRLARNHGLRKTRIKIGQASPGGPRVPVTVFAEGSIPDLLDWTAAVERAFPYLVARKLMLETDNGESHSRLEAVFEYAHLPGGRA